MSVWHFFLSAGVLVKSIMVLLLLLSVVSWSFILQRLWLYKHIKTQIASFEEQFWSGADLNRLYEILAARDKKMSGMARVFVEGFREYLRLRQQQAIHPNAVMAGTERSMAIAVQKEANNLDHQLSYLATVGSVSPYIGLLGTVWGIMHALMALGDVQQATLSMVAPGISEALVATAMGLFAAIPALVAYNRFTQSNERLLSRYEIFQEELTNILHRQSYLKLGQSL